MKITHVRIWLSLIIIFNMSQSFARIPRPGPNDPITIIRGLSAEKQNKSLWCWAAVSKMLISSKDSNPPSQCEIVSNVFGTNCCLYSSISCNQPFNVTKALMKLGQPVKEQYPKVNPNQHWSNRVDYSGWYQGVVASIEKGIPIAIIRMNAAGTADGSSHVVVAYATYRIKNIDYIIVFDPWDGKSKFWDKSYVTGNQAWIVTNTLE